MRLRVLLPALLAFCLAGCGFSPMYGQNAPGATNGRYIGPVTIDEMPGKAGFLLKAELEKRLQVENGGGPVRRLQVALSEVSGGLGFRVDESATRSDLILTAQYALMDEDGKTMLSGNARTTASYDVPVSAYGEIAAQEDARERAAENLAVKVYSELSLRLASKKVQR